MTVCKIFNIHTVFNFVLFKLIVTYTDPKLENVHLFIPWIYECLLKIETFGKYFKWKIKKKIETLPLVGAGVLEP